MDYLKVEWIHELPDEPITIFMELDHERNECRKVEVYQDGTCGFASARVELHNCRLSEVPIPSNEEIESDDQFRVFKISQDEFESVWTKALAAHDR